MVPPVKIDSEVLVGIEFQVSPLYSEHNCYNLSCSQIGNNASESKFYRDYWDIFGLVAYNSHQGPWQPSVCNSVY